MEELTKKRDSVFFIIDVQFVFNECNLFAQENTASFMFYLHTS